MSFDLIITRERRIAIMMSIFYLYDIIVPNGEQAVLSLFRPLDPAFPIEQQLATDTSPVVLVNLFTIDKADEAALLAAWANDAEFMKRQPGYISTQLHRAIGGSYAYLNYAVWESTAAFRAAFSHPEFQARLSAYPSSAVAAPHLFQKIAVPGVCVA